MNRISFDVFWRKYGKTSMHANHNYSRAKKTWQAMDMTQQRKALVYAIAYRLCYPDPDIRVSPPAFLGGKKWDTQELVPPEYFERFLAKYKINKRTTLKRILQIPLDV